MSETKKRGMTYLAAPYSHPDAAVREQRFLAINRAAWRLMQQGHVVFSPISHTHPIEVESKEVNSTEFWGNQDKWFEENASRFAVLMLDGWRESRGVAREIRYAEERGLIVDYLPASFGDEVQPAQSEESKDLVRKFASGAQRNVADGKGRFDLIPPLAMRALARRFEQGAKKFGADNWRKGMPNAAMLDSALRHLNEFKAGNVDEDHLAAAAWNVFCLIENRDDADLRAKQKQFEK